MPGSARGAAAFAGRVSGAIVLACVLPVITAVLSIFTVLSALLSGCMPVVQLSCAARLLPPSAASAMLRAGA
jgi:hypothetical protein